MFDVVCTTVNGGIPIFYRTNNRKDFIPFTTFSTLNAVITFADVQNVQFKAIHTDKHSFIWHSIGDSLIMAGIGDLNDSTIKTGLKLISTLIKMIIGDENIYNKNADRIKREIKPCLPIIDYILKSLTTVTIEKHLINFIEMQSMKDNKTINNCLYNWSETICSNLCWVIVDKKLCVATQDWWDLHKSDRKLLITIILASCYDQTTSADIPIFLPHSSTKVLLRLVCCMIVQGVWAAAICGPTPNLDDVEISAAKSFRTVINNFRSNSTKFELTSGYIIINTNSFKFMQNYYSSNDVQNGIILFYNKISSRLMNGILYILNN
ncbi:Hypothetical protein CINCED_3A016115 [Cinara cedri]|uniref:Uncharacterized protein n=1 Tax=Cinara cedri TaxID=506608 RepID=A0A5E4N7A0_9HEMI|nr:Hypothetical protein CINCED_3A016115 [Cinara cedri]